VKFRAYAQKYEETKEKACLRRQAPPEIVLEIAGAVVMF